MKDIKFKIKEGKSRKPWKEMLCSFCYFFFFLFLFLAMPCRILVLAPLVPQPIELVPSAVEVQTLNHWTPREVPLSAISKRSLLLLFHL